MPTNLEETVQSMINGNASEEEIASVIEEHDESENTEALDGTTNIIEERGEYGGKSGTWIHTDITKDIAISGGEDFDKAFAKAVANNKKTFIFEGKEYTTQIDTDQITTRTSEFIEDDIETIEPIDVEQPDVPPVEDEPKESIVLNQKEYFDFNEYNKNLKIKHEEKVSTILGDNQVETETQKQVAEVLYRLDNYKTPQFEKTAQRRAAFIYFDMHQQDGDAWTYDDFYDWNTSRSGKEKSKKEIDTLWDEYRDWKDNGVLTGRANDLKQDVYDKEQSSILNNYKNELDNEFQWNEVWKGIKEVTDYYETEEVNIELVKGSNYYNRYLEMFQNQVVYYQEQYDNFSGARILESGATEKLELAKFNLKMYQEEKYDQIDYFTAPNFMEKYFTTKVSETQTLKDGTPKLVFDGRIVTKENALLMSIPEVKIEVKKDKEFSPKELYDKWVELSKFNKINIVKDMSAYDRYHVVEYISSQTIETNKKMLKILGDEYFGEMIDGFIDWVDSKNFKFDGDELIEKATLAPGITALEDAYNMDRGSSWLRLFDDLLSEYLGDEDKYNAYKSYKNGGKPQNWLSNGSWVLPHNYIKNFQNTYNSEMIALFNELLTPKQVKEYMSVSPTITGVNLYKKFEYRCIRDEQEYLKKTGQPLLKSTTLNNRLYIPRVNIYNYDVPRLFIGDLMQTVSGDDGGWLDEKSYDVDKMLQMNQKEIQKWFDSKMKNVSHIEEMFAVELNKWNENFPDEILIRLKFLMDRVNSFNQSPTTLEEIKEYNEIIIEAQAIQEKLDIKGYKELHARLKYLEALIQTEISVLTKALEKYEEQGVIIEMARKNYDDWDLALYNIEMGVMMPLQLFVQDILLLDNTSVIQFYNDFELRPENNFRAPNTFNVDWNGSLFRSQGTSIFDIDRRIQSRFFADNAATISMMSFSLLTGGSAWTWAPLFFTSSYGTETYRLEKERKNAELYKEIYKKNMDNAKTEEEKFKWGRLWFNAEKNSNLNKGDIVLSSIYKGSTEVLTEYTLGFGKILRGYKRWNQRRLAGLPGGSFTGLIGTTFIGSVSNITQEGLVQILHNGWDKFYLGEDISLFKELDTQKFWDNVTWTTLVIQAPHLTRSTIAAVGEEIKTSRSKSKHKAWAKELSDLLAEKKDILENEKDEFDRLKDINERIKEIQQESEMQHYFDLSNLDDLSVDEMKEIFEIKRQLQQIELQLHNLGYAGDTQTSSHKNLKKILLERYDQLTARHEDLLTRGEKKDEEEAKEAKEKGKTSRSQGQMQYHLGLMRFYNKAVRAISEGKNDLEYFELDFELQQRLGADGKVEFYLTQKDIDLIRKRFPKDANQIINNFNKSYGQNIKNRIYVFTNNQKLGITSAAFQKAVGLQYGAASLAAFHELVHYVLWKNGLVTYEYDFDITEEDGTLESSKIKLKRVMNEALVNSLEELDQYLQEKLSSEELTYFRDKLKRYRELNNNQEDYEEFVTILSELIAGGVLTKTDINAMFHVKMFFSKMAQFAGFEYGAQHLFQKPEDIVTYLEILNRKVKADNLRIISSTEEESVDEEVSVSSIMEDLASEVDVIWDKNGANGAVEIISLYGGVYNMNTGEFNVIPNSMLDRAIKKYATYEGFDYEALANEFVTGKRGLMEMIVKEYNAKHKQQKDSETTEDEATLSMFLNKYFQERIKELSANILTPGVSTTEDNFYYDDGGNVNYEFFIDNQIDLRLSTVLGVEERIKEKIRQAVEKTFGTKLPPVTSLKFKTVVNNAIRAELNNVIREVMGGRSTAKFKAFLESNYEFENEDGEIEIIEVWRAIYEAIPQTVLNKSFQEWTQPVLDKQGRQVRPDNNRLFERKDITKEEFLRYFFGVDVKRSTQGTRKTSLINALAVTLSRHYVIEHFEDSKNLEKTENINEIMGYQKADNYLSRVTEALDLDPNNKLSLMDVPRFIAIEEIQKLKEFLKDNGQVKGDEINIILDSYLDDLEEDVKPFVKDIIENLKKIYSNYGTITMTELSEALDTKQKGEIDFTFFDSFEEIISEVTNGEVTLFDLKTKKGEKRFFELMGEFTNTLDPRFLELQTVINFFTASGTIGSSKGGNGFSAPTGINSKGKEVKRTYGVKWIKGKFNINLENTDFNVENVEPLTANEEKEIEEIIIAWKNNPNIDQNSNEEKKKLADQINTQFDLNSRREGVEEARDYMYYKLNDFINQYQEGTKERLEAISFVAKILKLQSSSKQGISRQGAFLSSVTLDYSTTEKKAFRWEHNIQLLNFNGNLLDQMIKGTFEENYETISSKYSQSLLDKDAQVALDGKDMLKDEFKEKYNISEEELEKYRGNTQGAPGFKIGMESEAIFIVALGNASRTLDLRTGLTMDQLIYNKINSKKAIDYLDGVADKIRINIPVSPNSDIIFNPKNKNKIFSNKYNTDLFNDILTLAVNGEDVTEKVNTLADSIKNYNKKDVENNEKANSIVDNWEITNKELEKYNVIVKNSLSGEFQGASTFDFDGTLGHSENVVIATLGDKRIELDGVDFAKRGLDLINKGWKMDFSDFNHVTNGTLGPVWPKFINQLIKYGPTNVYILTARAPEVQKALFDFVNAEIDKYNEENGTEVPHMIRENIVGLGDSTGEAKAKWIKDNLILNGFNDIYFIDDVVENTDAVQNMYNEFPDGTIKDGGKSVLVDNEYTKYSLSDAFNSIIEESSGVEAKKQYSDIQAELQGKRKWWQFNFFLDPSAEDFKGLIYGLLASGEKGEQQFEWFKENLIDPYDIGVAEVEKERIRLLNRYKDLIKNLPKIRKKLRSTLKRQDDTDSRLTIDNAIRVYIWTKAGYDMTDLGLSKRDLKLCLDTVENDPELKTLADALNSISETGYVAPKENWVMGTIASDIKTMSSSVSRSKYLDVFIKNKNEIFSKQNMNKLRAIHGDDYIEALEEMLYRMEKGVNRASGVELTKAEREFNEWINNSVGAIMFLNMRSATLQLISMTNFIDTKYNNPIAAAKAFASKDYWVNWLKIWQSDWLKSRAEKGGRTIQEEELIAAVYGSKNPISALTAFLLEKGFTPTSIADRLAITFGGASYLTNGIIYYNSLGFNDEDAYQKAFLDLQQKAKESQQSADPRFISSIQAGTLGRVIFAFKNTPMQYTRLIKRSMQDLLRGRGNPVEHVTKIIYYGAMQNFMFNALQTALFVALDDEDEEWDKKSDNVIQNMIDSILVGFGLKGAIVVTVKNGILEYYEQEEKGWNADHTYTILQFANFSPTIGSKLRKIYGAIKGKQLNADEIEAMNVWDPRNPAWASVTNLIEAFTNIPAARLNTMVNNLLAMSSDENDFMTNLMLLLGWNTWDLGVETKSDIIGEELKKEKEKAKEKEKEKRKRDQIQKIVNELVEEEIEEPIKGKKYFCPQVKKDNERCGVEVSAPGKKCTYHEDVPVREDGKRIQCSKIKSNGKQCGNKTMSKSGLCPIHDDEWNAENLVDGKLKEE